MEGNSIEELVDPAGCSATDTIAAASDPKTEQKRETDPDTTADETGGSEESTESQRSSSTFFVDFILFLDSWYQQREVNRSGSVAGSGSIGKPRIYDEF